MHDDELATIFREGLEHHASSAPRSLDRPVASRRRLTPWLAAAAAVVAVAGLTAVLSRGGHQAAPSPTTPSPSSYDMTGWRTESYGEMSLRVPRDWGLGASPMDPGTGDGPMMCADTPDKPYVGRPVMLSDVCISQADGQVAAPKVDAVWFDSPLDVGKATVDGEDQETRTLFGQRVTVWSEDAQLRTTIFDTADGPSGTTTMPFVDANGCGGQDFTGARDTKVGQPLGLSVCVYTQGDGAPGLLWSGRLGSDAARRYLDATVGASALFDPAMCTPDRRETEVLLRVEGTAGTRGDTVHPTCSWISMGAGGLAPLTDATVGPWAGEAIRLFVPGPEPWFKQPLG